MNDQLFKNTLRSETSFGSLSDQFASMPFYQRWFYILSAALCAYYIFRAYRWWCKRKGKQDDRTEIEKINEVYRGLNTEEANLQRQIKKHASWITFCSQV